MVLLHLKNIGFSTINFISGGSLSNGKNEGVNNNNNHGECNCEEGKKENINTVKHMEKFFNHHDFSAFLSFSGFHHHHHHHTPMTGSTDNNIIEESIAFGSDICTNLNKIGATFISSLLPQHKISSSSDSLLSNLSTSPTTPVQYNDEFFENNEYLSTILIYFISDIIINQPITSLKVINKSFTKSFNISEKLFHKYFKRSLDLTKYYLLELNKNKEYYLKLNDIDNKDFQGDKFLMEKIKQFNLNKINEIEKRNLANKYLNYLNTVSVTIYRGQKLQVKDLLTSDPFVNLFFTNEQDEKPHHHRESLITENLLDSSKPHHHHFKTTTKKKTLDPEWNESFIFSSNKPDQNILVATVYDFDKISKADFMGFASIHLDELYPSFTETVTNYKLQAKPKGKLTVFKSILGIAPSKQEAAADKTDYGYLKLGLVNLKREIYKLEEISIENNNVPGKEIDRLMNINHEKCMESLFDFFINKQQIFTTPKEIKKLISSYENRILFSPYLKFIVILEKLLEIFEISTILMDEILLTIKEVMKMLEMDTAPMTKPIEIKFKAILKQIKKLYKSLLSKYTQCFPVTINKKTKQPENYGTSGSLLAMTIETLESIYQYEHKDFEPKIIKQVEKYIEFCWSIVKEASLVKIEDSKEFENIVALLDIYDAMELQLTLDIEIYSQFFPSKIDLSSISFKGYYKLLKEYTESVLSRENKVCMETFTLLKKIQKISNTILKPYLNKDNEMNLNVIFKKFLSMWCVEIKKQFNLWVSRSLEKENWAAVDIKNNLLHSNSLIDLFTIFEIGKNHLLGLDLNIDHYIFDFIEIVNQLYNQYLDIVMNSILQDIIKDKSVNSFDEINDLLINNLNKLLSYLKQQKEQLADASEEHLLTSKSITNSAICIKLNSIEFSRQLLLDFSNDLEDKLPHLRDVIQESFSISFHNSKKKYDYIIDLVINNINKCIKVLLEKILVPASNNNNKQPTTANKTLELIDESISNQMLDSLLLLLNNELTILSGNLYYPTFNKFIKGVWESIWKSIDRILFPELKLQTEKYYLLHYKSLVVVSIYPVLENFFFANGEGVPVDQLRKLSQYLFSSVQVYFTEPKNIYEVYNYLEKNNNDKSLIDYNFISSNCFQLKQFNQFKDWDLDSSKSIGEFHILSYISSRNQDSSNEFTDNELKLKFKSIITTITSKFKNRFVLEKFQLKNQSIYQYSFTCKTLFGIPTLAYIMNDCICWSSFLSYNEKKIVINYSSIRSITRQQHDIQHDDTLIIISTDSEKHYEIYSCSNKFDTFNSLKNNLLKFNSNIHIIDHFNDTIGDNSNFIVQPRKDSLLNKSLNPNSLNATISCNDHSNEHVSHVSYDDNIKFHTLFHLDKDNIIYEVYSCFKHGISGRIITTRDYFCYHNNVTGSNQHFLWSDLVSIKKESFLFTNGIRIIFKNGQNKFFTGINNIEMLLNELIELKDLNSNVNRSPILQRKKKN
ncbi:hypothetical protein DICPUDRAFT_33829 [Dictyostelium purpureum]|uniref:C2 domain-containing protein n=1 Tax=Dictyostelium purpureum TaxID=5786 RepID=F0ZLL5_DICPU|nr:uncharacterized protein DICPUDRAFT_33829 [Dictyostelium purpureum]EGC35160.1 hypothetical protein DICPUDRAFT_33829 [Dictyostelium purpureum]|eukprot:XP_003288298.1 hypothetical protein DICPUDRAFT_33829 [Dictyostelium purpureum]